MFFYNLVWSSFWNMKSDFRGIIWDICKKKTSSNISLTGQNDIAGNDICDTWHLFIMIILTDISVMILHTDSKLGDEMYSMYFSGISSSVYFFTNAVILQILVKYQSTQKQTWLFPVNRIVIFAALHFCIWPHFYMLISWASFPSNLNNLSLRWLVFEKRRRSMPFHVYLQTGLAYSDLLELKSAPLWDWLTTSIQP